MFQTFTIFILFLCCVLFLVLLMNLPISKFNKTKLFSKIDTPKNEQLVRSCYLPVGHAKIHAHYVIIGRHVVGVRNISLAQQLVLPYGRHVITEEK